VTLASVMLRKACNAPLSLEHGEIARRIPHQGTMCLLDRVTAWDSSQINCEATTHRAAANPLRAHGRLGAACGIEYAAQAMAVHGALVCEAAASAQEACTADGNASPIGYLVSVRGVTLHVERLDDIDSALAIWAERMSGDTSSILYAFTVHAGPALLLSGRAVVMLDAPSTGTSAVPRETP
jgi:predicted hotdog family 3-hydroxylacyl-ACP dehydratase